MKRTSLVGFVATAVLLPFLVSVASEVAKPYLPGAFSRATQWTTVVIEWSWTPWVFSGVAGVLVGMWLDRVLSVMDGRQPLTRSGKLRNLAGVASEIATDCEMAISADYSGLIKQNSLRAQIFMIGKKLSKLGIHDPYIPEDASPWLTFTNVASILSAILPAMREGDLETAIYLSSLVREGQRRSPTKEPPRSYPW